MNTAFNRRHHLNRQCVVLSRDSIYAVCKFDKKWKKHVNVQADSMAYVWLHMWFPNVTKRIAPCSENWNQNFTNNFRFNCSNSGSREAFPRRSEGCPKHMDTTMSHVWNLSLSIAGMHSKNFAQQACIHTQIWWIFVSKRYLPEWASDQQSTLAQHKNILVPGVWFFWPWWCMHALCIWS